MYDDNALHNLKSSLEVLKELLRSQQAYIRQIEQERDLLLSWYRASMVRFPATANANLILEMQ
jgi:hypothetical protein